MRTRLAPSIVATALLLIVGQACAQTAAAGSAVEAAYQAILAHPKVIKTLDEIKADDANALAEQKRITEIPAPPYKEKVRAEYFLKRFAAEHHRTPKCFHAEAIARLQEHHWPGNIRELENLILRELVLAEGDVIELRSIPNKMPDRLADRELDSTFRAAKAQALAEFEKIYLDRLLTRTRGNISLAARISQKDRSALNKLVRKHGLSGEQFRSAAG